MSKRRTPTLAEQLNAMRMLADVAALKADPATQQRHLVDALTGLFNVRSAQFAVADGYVLGKPQAVRHQVLGRDPDPAFVKAASELATGITTESEPYADHVIRTDAVLQIWSRDRVLSRPDARQRYAVTLTLEEAARVVDGTTAVIRTGRDRVIAFSMHRSKEEGRFSSRDQALLEFIWRELRDLEQRGHLPTAAPLPPGLAPRLQQVLDRLLAGEGIKRIARELDLSAWTVREHVQRLYRHFGVNTREELMARFVVK